MFWAYRPPSFTFPSMRLEALSAMSATIRTVLLLATKNCLNTGHCVSGMRFFPK
jgi:hypothetical protein